MGICRKSTCSDSVTASEDADTSGYGVHQVIAKDDAREPMGSDDSEADAARTDAYKSKILSEEDTLPWHQFGQSCQDFEKPIGQGIGRINRARRWKNQARQELEQKQSGKELADVKNS